MHCPRCGQKQISREIKFCSRCGFRMPLVARLLENDGTLPELQTLQKSGIFTRRNGIVFTILWLIFWLMMLPAFFGILDAEFPAAVSAVFGIFSSLMLFVISIAFLPPHRKQTDPVFSPPAPLELPQKPAAAALGAKVQESAAEYASPAGRWREPELARPSEPGSVTETTTKLLKDE